MYLFIAVTNDAGMNTFMAKLVLVPRNGIHCVEKHERLVENWEESDILPYVQADELADLSFMDAPQRYNTPGSETKDFVTTIAAARGPAFSCRSFLSPNSHKTTHRGPSDSYTHSELHEGEKGKKRDESLENLTLLYWTVKYVCSLF